VVRKILPLLFFIFGCSVEVTATDSDAATIQPGKENCPAACQKIEEIGCWPKNGTCLPKCNQQHEAGYFWNTECLMKINTCDEMLGYCRSIIDFC
jgi:hypothetical protein